MNKEMKRISIAAVLMFLLLFISTTTVQSITADELNNDPRNRRSYFESYDIDRGPILVSGSAIAQSLPVSGDFPFLRTYSNGELYAPVTGYFTIGQGLTGIEQTHNAYLNGADEGRFLDQIQQLITGQSIKGSSVELSLDAELQEIAYAALGDYTGAVVALDYETGQLLALVSKPSFDPNQLSSHNTAAVLEYYKSLIDDPKEPLQNRAIAGDLYYPGSVFKLVVAAEALESGKYTPDSEFANPISVQLPGSNHQVYNSTRTTCGNGETATLELALALSCNVQFVELGLELGQDAIRERAELFGFNRDLQIPLSVTASIFPEHLDDAQLGLASFGQSNLRVTPLEVAMFTAAIANQGTLMEPRIVDRVLSPNFSLLYEGQDNVLSRPISPETASALTDIMVRGVESGAATGVRIPGVTVAGKTGTAETGFENYRHLWFTGFLPENDRKIVVTVLIEKSDSIGWGNVHAAPIAKTIFEAVLAK